MRNADDWTQSTPRKPKPPRDRSIGLRYGGRTRKGPPSGGWLFFFTDFRTDRPPQPPHRARPSSFSPWLSRSGGRQWCGGDDHCRPPTLHKRRILTHWGPTNDIKMSLWCPEPGLGLVGWCSGGGYGGRLHPLQGRLCGGVGWGYSAFIIGLLILYFFVCSVKGFASRQGRPLTDQTPKYLYSRDDESTERQKGWFK